MSFTTLIASDVLAQHLGDPDFVVVDCRFRLDDETWGEREYASRHIAGAVYAHLNRDLSGSTTGTNGRHPLPDPLVLAETFGRFGIANSGGRRVQVVAYDQDNGMFASRLWWLCRWLGHDAVAVLDGGFARWLAEGRPAKSGIETRRQDEFRPAPRSDLVVDAQQVSRMLGTPDWRLLDARAPEEHERAGNVSTTGGAPGSDPSINRTHGTRSNRLLLRLGSDGVPQSAGNGARRDSRREAVSGLVERVVGGPGEAD
jgi:thiosulfate/3-mercaptopyruvate sulfurtransferase